MLDPANMGTTGILKSIKLYALGVKRVVVTTSFAAMLDSNCHPDIYSEGSWNPVTIEEALNPAKTYRASKTFAEKAAWAFVETESPNFTLTTLCPALVFSPVIHQLESLENINTSNAMVRDLIQGCWKEKIPPSGIYLWVDVRDLALAHVLALEKSEAAGQRFLVVAGYFDNKQVADVVRKEYPELDGKLPSTDVPGDLPANVYNYENSKSVKILGLEYRSLKESIGETAKSLMKVKAHN